MIYLVGCKCFLDVTDHGTLPHLVKQPIDKLTYRQVHFVEPLMSLLIGRPSFTFKGHDKADLVSRRPDYQSGRCPPARAN